MVRHEGSCFLQISAPPPYLGQDYEQNGFGEKRGRVRLNRLSGRKMGERYGARKAELGQAFQKERESAWVERLRIRLFSTFLFRKELFEYLRETVILVDERLKWGIYKSIPLEPVIYKWNELEIYGDFLRGNLLQEKSFDFRPPKTVLRRWDQKRSCFSRFSSVCDFYCSHYWLAMLLFWKYANILISRRFEECWRSVCQEFVSDWLKLLQKMELERLLMTNRSYCVKHLNKSMNTHFDTYYSNMQLTYKLVSSIGMLGNLSSGRQGRCRCPVFHNRVGAKHQH